MSEVTNKMEGNRKYPFRFTASNQRVDLTEHQLSLIPYLSTLITHKDNFLSIENTNGEYVLNPPLEHLCFLAILSSITSQNPYKLFDKLPVDEDIFRALELFDFLGLPPFPLPILRKKSLVERRPVPGQYLRYSSVYHKATLAEACRTAAEFVFALANDEYQLNDSNTKNAVFDLVNIILVNAEVFSFPFRHHTLTIAKKRCYPFFYGYQQRQLERSYEVPQYNEINSDNFNNSFSWRGSYVSLRDQIREVERITTNSLEMFDFFDSMLSFDLPDFLMLSFDLSDFPMPSFHIESTHLESSYPYPIMEEDFWSDGREEISIVDLKQVRKIEEAQSARSGRFNTLPKRPVVDKFKHRSGPKAQKYR